MTSMAKLFDEIPTMALKFPSILWFKFQWYKRIRKMNIIGFYDRIPIIASKYLEKDREDNSD